MKTFRKLICLLGAPVALAAAVLPARADFTPGNLVIFTDPSTTSSAGAITLNEYTYNAGTGTFNSTPTAHSVTGLTIPGDNDHDGLLRLSSIGGYLTFAGYQAPPGTPGLVASASVRAIGRVDSSWNLTTYPITGYAGVAVRSVASTNGTEFWVGGDQGVSGGQYYVNPGSATQNLISADDARGNRIDRGQYWSFSSGVGGASRFTPALPTSAATSTLAIGSPYIKSDAVFLDLNNDGTSETAYTTDGKNLLGKWSLSGSTWSQNGSWTGTKANINDINSLEAFVYNGNVKLLAATQLGQLFQFTDSNGINPNFDPAFLANVTPTPFFTAGGGTIFRGMAIVPEPTGIALFALASLFMRRRCAGAR